MPLSGHDKVMMTLHFFKMTSLTTLNQHKIKKDTIIASLKSETIGKLMNRAPCSRLLISSLPGSSKAEPGKLDIKRHSPYRSAHAILVLTCNTEA